ncbi:TetR/AcrR family transcriptional regulator [Nakamurella sp.]|uniref:TetR/AcrR family transcriptional regulator n=1 Tax=Nakamurella sp. TaxID=1869182 RepID=UPI003B3BA01D
MDRALSGDRGADDRAPSSTDGTARSAPSAPVAPPGPQRRPPYGRNPLLAAHGVRARAEMIEAARVLFARQGYQATTVESIGEATGRSGAAVYQYFSGKFEIFEIFLHEVGHDLREIAGAFPALADDRAGRTALRDWIARLMAVIEHHSGIFLGWSQIQYAEPDLARVGQENFQLYQQTVMDRLVQAGAHAPNPGVVPVGMISVIQWSTLLNADRARPVDREKLADAVAGMLQAFLFDPATDVSLAEPDAPIDYHLPVIPLGDELGLRRPVTPRGVGTVQRILLAAADRFRVNGFQGTSLNDVAARAGVSHGSVYTYWADREALFGTLARDAIAAVRAQRGRVPGPGRPDGPPGPVGEIVDRWLDGWMSLIDVHGSVLYVWQHEIGGPVLDDLTPQRDEALDGIVDDLLGLCPEPPADPEPLRVVLRAVITDVPFVVSAQLAILPRAEAADFVAQLLRAGLQAASGSAGPAPGRADR